MKKIILLLLVVFTFSEVHSAVIKSGDEDQLSSLLDSFSVSMVNKDKIWMGANISDACLMYDPSGITLDKPGIIKTFSEGIYNISKASVSNKVFKVAGADANGSAEFIVEGIGNINGDSFSLNGNYKFSVKFRKSDKGWQISEVLIN